MTTNTMIATTSSPALSPAWATPAIAAMVRARFFGLSPESTTPKPNALPAVNWSIVAIHFGVSGVSPALGRPCHCFSAEEEEQRAERRS